jgi:flagellin
VLGFDPTNVAGGGTDVLVAEDILERGKTYKVVVVPGADDIADVIAAQSDLAEAGFIAGATFTMDSNVTIPAAVAAFEVIPVMAATKTYEIVTVPAETADQTTIINNTNLTSTDQLVVGMAFTVNDGATIEPTGEFDAREIDANAITSRIESVQGKINLGRVQAGSQYAALESAVTYTTDLTAQYELAYNTVHDVNFSMETAHLAKNQILQQAATAMLAQANEGQQGLLQLIQ